jgi:hypothetical protein
MHRCLLIVVTCIVDVSTQDARERSTGMNNEKRYIKYKSLQHQRGMLLSLEGTVRSFTGTVRKTVIKFVLGATSKGVI